MALTFGTLLSSQGTDAHRSGPLGRSRGNSLNLVGLVRPVKPCGLAGRAHPRSRTRRCRVVPVERGAGGPYCSSSSSVILDWIGERLVFPLLSGAPAAMQKLRGIDGRVKSRGREQGHNRAIRGTAACPLDSGVHGGTTAARRRGPATDAPGTLGHAQARSATPTVRLPRRRTRNRPCSQSDSPGTSSGSVTLTLLR
jgi:hypothetical protein